MENGLGKRCHEGILLNEDVAYTYMSILAEIISKEMEIDIPLAGEFQAMNILCALGMVAELTGKPEEVWNMPLII